MRFSERCRLCTNQHCRQVFGIRTIIEDVGLLRERRVTRVSIDNCGKKDIFDRMRGRPRVRPRVGRLL